MESRQERIDRGYAALTKGRWEEAGELFDGLLAEDPHCGMSCLGKALALRQLHGREELVKCWENLSKDPDFLRELEPARPDFLPWLREDMEAPEEPRYEEPEEYSDLGRRLLLCFAAVQVCLFLLVLYFFCKAQWDPENVGTALLGNLIFSAMICGAPVILGPLYGNSIVEAGRFCKLLHILNNLVGFLGCVLTGILTAAFYSAFREEGGLREDWYTCTAMLTAFLIHLLSLIFPAILDKVEYDL